MSTDAITEINSFSIQFPSKTDVIEKALIIGATILMVQLLIYLIFTANIAYNWRHYAL